MKAVIKTGGKQYYVSEGDFIYVEKLDGEAGDKVIFNEVLMCDNKVGNPYLNGASVEGEIVKNGKGKNSNFFTFTVFNDFTFNRYSAKIRISYFPIAN